MIQEIKKKLNTRQQIIVTIFERANRQLQVNQILGLLEKQEVKATRMTINRDIDVLIDAGFLQSIGAGRSTAYTLASGFALLKQFDVHEYFMQQALLRDAREALNPEVFEYFKDVQCISNQENEYLENVHRAHQTKIQKFGESSAVAMKKELERLIIDLAWKSSQIEGNTYSILETETLIKENIKAKGKTEAEATMILNHKKAVDFIMSNQNYFKQITVKKVQELHSVLVGDLGIQHGFRDMPVRITGTKYTPIFGQESISSTMHDMVDTVNALENVFEKALAVLALVAYIQPFQDGNKRTSRLLANAILYAHGYSMLSYSSADAIEYRKAVILFYEQNSVDYLKQIFIDQYKFAVENYFV